MPQKTNKQLWQHGDPSNACCCVLSVCRRHQRSTATLSCFAKSRCAWPGRLPTALHLHAVETSTCMCCNIQTHMRSHPALKTDSSILAVMLHQPWHTYKSSQHDRHARARRKLWRCLPLTKTPQHCANVKHSNAQPSPLLQAPRARRDSTSHPCRRHRRPASTVIQRVRAGLAGVSRQQPGCAAQSPPSRAPRPSWRLRARPPGLQPPRMP